MHQTPPAPHQPAVELIGVEKAYPIGSSQFFALRDISLRIAPGRLVALSGRSGSGKSTLLNLIGAADRPSAGTIRVDGSELRQLSDAELTLFRRRRLGYVFQAFYLLPSLTVFDNVAVPFTLDRRLGAQQRADVESLLERLELTEQRHRLPDQLSGGQQQRVAL